MKIPESVKQDIYTASKKYVQSHSPYDSHEEVAYINGAQTFYARAVKDICEWLEDKDHCTWTPKEVGEEIQIRFGAKDEVTGGERDE
jgi:predicted ATPase with chaperone activity